MKCNPVNKNVDTKNTIRMQHIIAEFYYNIRPQSLQFQFNYSLSAQGHISINSIVSGSSGSRDA